MSIKPNRLAAATLLACGAWLAVSAQSPGGGVYVVSFQDAVSPATSHYITSGIDQAIAANAELLIIEMDTPGGLDSSMRDIIQAILNSPVPVASFVYPEGARAASAGTYILYASHIAAMAPATATGAATPVALGGTPVPAPPNPLDGSDDGSDDEPANETGGETAPAAGQQGQDASRNSAPGENAPPAPTARFPEPATASERKAVNDAAAYIRSLAELRGRNADWAERAVRAGESVSASEALALGVIDLIAADRTDLLAQLDGRLIDGNRLTLPASIPITLIEPDWRTKLLSIITNPNVALVLVMVGLYGLMFEGYNPGAIVPGVVGAICLLLAAYALQILPVNYAGLALMLLGLILIVAEFFVPSFGALGIGGIAAFVFGAVILIDTDIPGFQVATSFVVSIAFAGSLALAGTVWLAMRARDRRVVSGIEQMAGLTAEALEDFEHEGQVWIHGERWQARAAVPIRKGQALTVRHIDGLVLQVEPAARQNTEMR
jgi:membrane-bound serine protease (ClpP class)